MTTTTLKTTTKNWVSVLMTEVGPSKLRASAPEFVPKGRNPRAAEFVPAAIRAAKLAADQAPKQAIKELMTVMTAPFVEEKPLLKSNQHLYKRADGRTVVFASSLDSTCALMDQEGYWAVPKARPLGPATIALCRAQSAKVEYNPWKATDPDTWGRYRILSEDEEEYGPAYFGW